MREDIYTQCYVKNSAMKIFLILLSGKIWLGANQTLKQANTPVLGS